MAIGLTQSSQARADEAKEIRLGFFPNVTHAQPLYGKATGSYEKSLGVPIRWTSFNAGPAAMEALFAGAIDATYIGPNPAINGYIKSKGEMFRIVAGSASGGAALVVRSDTSIQSNSDFANKTIATPQLGNTQDVAARAWFAKQNLQPKEKGGTLSIVPLANPDQLLMFKRKEIDGAWTIEPWVSRLENEAGGKVFLEEKTLWNGGKYVTTHLIVTTKFLKESPALTQKLIEAHIDATNFIKSDAAQALKIVNEQIKAETGAALEQATIEKAFTRIEFTWDPIATSLFKAAQSAYDIGFLKETPKLEGIYSLDLLNVVLKNKNLPVITQ